MAQSCNWIQRSAELEKSGEPFAIATVIDTIAPTSAKPMSKAIITPDGKMDGWIGGGCAQDIIIDEAIKCIKTGKSSVIRLSPDDEKETLNSYKKNVLINCESEGTLECHIEPVIPMKTILIFGATPTAETLANMSRLLNYDVRVMGKNVGELSLSEGIQTSNNFKSFNKPSFAIIATQGQGDLRALKIALDSKPEYLGLISSKRKGEKLINKLVAKGYNKIELKKIKYPAGLNIGAVTPQEIATSIIAEIVKESRPKLEEELVIDFMQIKQGQEKDPICGMGVNPSKTDYQFKFKGKEYYFCCEGCLEKFESEPAVYV